MAGRQLTIARPLASAIVNVTSDSFWEGARSRTAEQAIADGRRLLGEGFDLVDVGAVAARSGPPVAPETEAAALVPAVRGLAAAGAIVSADTFSAHVAREAVGAGAAIVNDISGAADPHLLEVCAQTGCGLVLMHIEGPARQDRPNHRYDDVAARLLEFFGAGLQRAASYGVAAEQIVLDPGLDFDLSVADDLEIVRRLGELRSLDRPLYLAISRKDFLGAVLAGSWEGRLDPGRRSWATVGLSALVTYAGAGVLRVHDAEAVDAMLVAAALRAESGR
ncbi:MAG: dihydropteroate synthase [Solirubrobacterales bacterium]